MIQRLGRLKAAVQMKGLDVRRNSDIILVSVLTLLHDDTISSHHSKAVLAAAFSFSVSGQRVNVYHFFSSMPYRSTYSFGSKGITSRTCRGDAAMRRISVGLREVVVPIFAMSSLTASEEADLLVNNGQYHYNLLPSSSRLVQHDVSH